MIRCLEHVVTLSTCIVVPAATDLPSCLEHVVTLSTCIVVPAATDLPSCFLNSAAKRTPSCLQANAPDPARLPQDDIVGVTVLLLTCSYQQQVRAHMLDSQVGSNQLCAVSMYRHTSPVISHGPRLAPVLQSWALAGYLV